MGDAVITSAQLVHGEEIATGTEIVNTTIGGLSPITHNHDLDVYYLLADVREGADARFYTVSIDLSDLDAADAVVTSQDVTLLRRSDGRQFGNDDLDTEGISYTNQGTLEVSSEREPPAVYEFGLEGKLIRYFNIPEHYQPTASGTVGTRSNLGFEGLSLSPNSRQVWAANENAIVPLLAWSLHHHLA